MTATSFDVPAWIPFSAPPPKIMKPKPRVLRVSYLARLYADFDGRCAYCDQETFIPAPPQRSGHRNRATIDHAVPVSRGGSKAYENLALACFGCNNLKADMTPPEFLRSLLIMAMMMAWASPRPQAGPGAREPNPACGRVSAASGIAP